jgi:hypothetical protein
MLAERPGGLKPGDHPRAVSRAEGGEADTDGTWKARMAC